MHTLLSLEQVRQIKNIYKMGLGYLISVANYQSLLARLGPEVSKSNCHIQLSRSWQDQNLYWQNTMRDDILQRVGRRLGGQSNSHHLKASWW